MNVQMTSSAPRVVSPGRDVVRSRRIRSRRVRMSYPAALVELALLICGTFGALRATSELGIGKSTLYRWRNAYRTAWMPRYRKGIDGKPDRWDELASELCARCERAGYPLRSSLVRGSVTAPTHDVCEQSAEGLDVNAIAMCPEPAGASEKMIRAKREIDNNYASRQSIDRLADLVDLPRIKFIKQFAATFGVSPYRYLLGVRFRHAVALLEYSKASFAVVAAATGFGTAASMQHAFKRFAGVTPAKLMNTIAPRRDALVRSANTN